MLSLVRPPARTPWLGRVGIAAGFAVLVFVAALVGIYSRMPGTLAAIWPANALLLGLLIRFPAAATPATWVAAAVGYLGADLATGSNLSAALLLNSANLLGVLVGFYGLGRARAANRKLDDLSSIGWLSGLVTIPAAAAALLGALAQVVLFGDPFGPAWLGWYAEEVLNFTVVLPLVLTFPGRGTAMPSGPQRRRLLIPALFLLASAAPSWFMYGFGTVAFSAPALITVAMLSTVFATTVFLAVASVWSLVLIVHHGSDVAYATAVPIAPSAMIALAMLGFALLTIAAVTAERRRAYRVLRKELAHDDLTGAYRRGEFLERAQNAMARTGADEPAALLMMDLDHFKQLNDTLGHHAGDRALIDFAAAVRELTGSTALFARMGGEEFALLLPETDRAGAVEIAERIRAEQQERAHADFDGAMATVSIGLAWSPRSTVPLSELLVVSDEALYQAKTNRRNAVVVAEIAASD